METNELNYFESYEDIEIHELMLRDTARNEAYRSAIVANKDHIQNKIVLDVGSGTGILSVLCAQAGASKVYAVEASNYAAITKEVAVENKFEHIIEVINKRIEDTELPEKVDIIVSEWMGFYLLHEGMLDSVIYARDHFLKPDGCLFPQIAKIYAAPCSMPSMFEFWDNVHGISMQSVGKISRLFKSLKPEICVVNSDDILCDPKLVSSFDLKTVQVNDLIDIQLIDIAVSSKEGSYQGFCLWFDVEFPNIVNKLDNPIILSTSPNNQPTHWKQSVVILPQEIEVEEGTPIAFEVKLTRCEDNIRRYNIEFALLDPNEMEHPMGCDCFMTKCIVAKVFVQNQSENTEICT